MINKFLSPQMEEDISYISPGEIVEIGDGVAEDEVVVGIIKDEELKKVFTLYVSRKRLSETLEEKSAREDDPAALRESKLQCSYSKLVLVTFWFLIRQEFPKTLSYPCVGVKEGWTVVGSQRRCNK